MLTLRHETTIAVSLACFIEYAYREPSLGL